MAEASVSVSQDHFTCPICLYLLKDPVTISCGHSYCMDCITDCWDHEETRSYSCPQCRQTFTPRPVIGKNTILAEMVERIKKTVIQSDSSSSSPPLYAGPGDVACDVCIGRKHKAVKSCLVCLTSYCETHLRDHNNLNPGKKHKVIDAVGKLEDLICSHHDKLLEFFCRTDQTCICVQCVMDEHSVHNTVSVATERTEKQKQLEEYWIKIPQTIQERQNHQRKIEEALKSLHISAQAAVEDSERSFTEMIQSIERRRSEVIELIRDQERAEVSRAEELMEKLEQEIGQLKMREEELEQLSQTENDTTFLQRLCSLTDVENSSTDISVCSDMSFEKIKKNVSQLRDNLEEFLKEGVLSISDGVKVISSPLLRPREPMTRGDFCKDSNTHTGHTRLSPVKVASCGCGEPLTRADLLRYSRQFNLDPDTAQPNLHLPDGTKEVACKYEMRSLPDNPERFDYWQQVLCKERVTGRSYWEVQWSRSMYTHISTHVSIALSLKEITRKGTSRYAWFGHNDDSLCLTCTSSGCTFQYNGQDTNLHTAPSSKIGVYVDETSRILAFYNITGDTITLLHKLQTPFTEPFYPGFWLEKGTELKLCDKV